MSYIESTIIKEKVIKIENKAEAVRIYNYPYVALEEAIVNAIYHRSYEEREPIEIRVYPEKIIVVSYPGPDKSIKKTDIESGNVIARRYRNRRIGEFLVSNKGQDKRKSRDMLSNLELKILKMIEKETLSKQQISTELGYKSTTGNIKRAIKNLLEKELIDYTVPEKITSRNQKYKIT